ncbi:MAG: glutamate formimidoyltransferase [Gemmatimonadetes bacterium]|nr:glutamate formimidoyltransferase [Gemmatimonadota bacterium]
MAPVLEAVPNFSAGRDPALLERLVGAVSDAGAEVLDVSADADHNRAVLTYVGTTAVVEEASVSVARLAVEAIDLRRHRGVHPRVGALDVLPFVPLVGLTMADARSSARRVGERLAREVGVPVYFYGEASEPPGRGLGELRRGGFEQLVLGFPDARRPDLLPDGWEHPGVHPSAGATCVGARLPLLAWNVEVEGLGQDRLEAVAARMREQGGGFPKLRALALVLVEQSKMQISMNLEDVENQRPFDVFQALEERVRSLGGTVRATEVVGMIPDRLLLDAAADRLGLLDPNPGRVLSPRLVKHIDDRGRSAVRELTEAVRAAGDRTPPEVRAAAERLQDELGGVEPRDGRP